MNLSKKSPFEQIFCNTKKEAALQQPLYDILTKNQTQCLILSV